MAFWISPIFWRILPSFASAPPGSAAQPRAHMSRRAGILVFMDRLIEFTTNHPYLVAALLLMIAVVIVSEIRWRIQAFAAVTPAEAVRLINHGAAVIDVRGPAQFQSGHIAEARNVDPKNLGAQAES